MSSGRAVCAGCRRGRLWCRGRAGVVWVTVVLLTLNWSSLWFPDKSARGGGALIEIALADSGGADISSTEISSLDDVGDIEAMVEGKPADDSSSSSSSEPMSGTQV
eukprot:Filipodium_phascolosomae@DN8433_c0_g1_i1.p2